jgi:hypothetical protein
VLGYNLINHFNLFILGESPGGGGERAVPKVPGPVYRRELSQKGHLIYFNLIYLHSLFAQMNKNTERYRETHAQGQKKKGNSE